MPGEWAPAIAQGVNVVHDKGHIALRNHMVIPDMTGRYPSQFQKSSPKMYYKYSYCGHSTVEHSSDPWCAICADDFKVKSWR